MKRFSLLQTIIALSVMLFTIQLISSSISIIRISSMGTDIDKVETLLIPLTETITLLTEHQLEQEIEFERAFRFALISTNQNKKNFEHAKEEFHLLNKKIIDELSDSQKLLTLALTKIDNDETQKTLKLLKKDFTWIKEKHAIWVTDVENVFSLLTSEEIDDANHQAEKVEALAMELEHKVITILHNIEDVTKHTIHDLKLKEQSILMFAVIALVFSFVTAILMTRYVTNNLKRDIEQLRIVINRISKGDLVTQSESRLGDEFNINNMRTTLNDTLSVVDDSANEMLASSSELAEISEGVNGIVDEQAIEIEQVSSAIAEMEATSVEVARNAENTQLSTNSVASKAVDSIKTIDNAMLLISQLTDTLSNSSTKIKELETHCDQISSVLDIIKAIADQTNLLALNAAIEAARAGEQGRGFAVVADEVRNLAQRTQESTVEIESIVELFTRSTNEAVVSMSKSTEQGSSSQIATQEAHDKIIEIQTDIAAINDMNNQIATAAEEQSCTSQEISKNTININRLANNSLESVSKVSASSEELAHISKALKEQLSHFKLSLR